MAHAFRDIHDTNFEQDNNLDRWTKNCENDRQGLPSSHSPHRFLLLAQLDLWKQGLSVSLGGFHPDVEGKINAYMARMRADAS